MILQGQGWSRGCRSAEGRRQGRQPGEKRGETSPTPERLKSSPGSDTADASVSLSWCLVVLLAFSWHKSYLHCSNKFSCIILSSIGCVSSFVSKQFSRSYWKHHTSSIGWDSSAWRQEVERAQGSSFCLFTCFQTDGHEPYHTSRCCASLICPMITLSPALRRCWLAAKIQRWTYQTQVLPSGSLESIRGESRTILSPNSLENLNPELVMLGLFYHGSDWLLKGEWEWQRSTIQDSLSAFKSLPLSVV